MADSSSQWKESLSLEETNKIRVSLGLKPIADPAAASSGPPAALEGEALAEDNYAKRRAEEQKAKEAKELKERIDKARNQKERIRKLGGRGLGDLDEDEAQVKQEEGAAGDDAKAWVRRQKKRAKELAAKRAKEQEEEDRLAEEEERDRANKYGERDLAGLKVAHGAEAFEEGEDTVLTLKDSRILDDEDDELHNVNLSENAKTKHALDLKKKGKNAGQYTGLDDDEFEGGPGSSRGVLSKYDEDFDSIKVDGFRLGSAPSAASAKGKGRATDGDDAMNGSSEREKVKLSMDYTKTFNTDYLQEGEAGFKKPKKKKRRAMRTTTLGDEPDDAAAGGDGMDVDGEPATPRRIERVSLDETNLIDDDDLQLSLARQRREAAKQKIKEIKARTAAAPPPRNNGDATVKKEDADENAETTLSRGANVDEDDVDDGDVLVLDDTSEFVRNISLAATAAAERAQKEAEKERRREEEAAIKRERGGSQSVLPRVKAEEQDVPLSEMDADAAPVNGGWGPAREDGEEDDQMYDFDAPAYGVEAAREERQISNEPKPHIKVEDDELATTAQEQLVSRGLASTLSLLRHQGLLQTRTPEELAREKELKQREAWLAQQRRRQEEREREKIESRKMGDKKDQQQREYENRMREQREAQSTLEAFANYKPAVNLTYHDKFGRDLTPKEAWKQLNYDFHGYGSGAKKTDKRLQKIENERKQMAMAAGDTPRSTAAAFAARAEKTGSATMILGVGNNNSAPMDDHTLGGVPRIEKNLKGKGKAVVAPHGRSGRSATPSGPNGAQPVFADIPMRPLPLPSGSPREASGTPEPSRKAGFAPVRSFSPATAAAEEERRNGGESGPKLSIAVKRKALGEGEDSPASKRRA
ncbi:hypothetical protein BMF94_2132 [Rhodotorula taiwanensis]|uniref:SART-1 protein n=1 Tax=Rhodotorula taiwanensis TaxID=741276 RepID=A0A2S5BDL3_9BASI|nr:hypothetical protein BMF94_2132 [Rhodotorula taiwanensis]